MNLVNQSALPSEYLTTIFRDVAHKAKISLAKVARVEVRKATRALRGVAYAPDTIFLWIPKGAQRDSIAFLFAHELGHLVKEAAHGRRKRKDKEAVANKFAMDVTGIEKKKVVWRQGWSSYQVRFLLEESAQSSARTLSQENQDYEFRVVPAEWHGRTMFKIQWKLRST